MPVPTHSPTRVPPKATTKLPPKATKTTAIPNPNPTYLIPRNLEPVLHLLYTYIRTHYTGFRRKIGEHARPPPVWTVAGWRRLSEFVEGTFGGGSMAWLRDEFRRIHEAKMREEGARWKRERLEGMVEGARRVLGRESSLWRS